MRTGNNLNWGQFIILLNGIMSVYLKWPVDHVWVDQETALISGLVIALPFLMHKITSFKASSIIHSLWWLHLLYTCNYRWEACLAGTAIGILVGYLIALAETKYIHSPIARSRCQRAEDKRKKDL